MPMCMLIRRFGGAGQCLNARCTDAPYMLFTSLIALYAKLLLFERCKRMEQYLDDSARGPTGDLESSRGLLPSCTFLI